jgi:hypothetical protein
MADYAADAAAAATGGEVLAPAIQMSPGIPDHVIVYRAGGAGAYVALKGLETWAQAKEAIGKHIDMNKMEVVNEHDECQIDTDRDTYLHTWRQQMCSTATSCQRNVLVSLEFI